MTTLTSDAAWPARRWPWPLPALAAWALAWGLNFMLPAMGASSGLAFACACGAGAAWAAGVGRVWRRWIVALGFPLSALALGMAAPWPAWFWLAPLGALMLAYPLRAWRDAPFFPTPPQALRGLDRVVPLAPGARVLDAGCGLGHGLRALHRVYPHAAFEGVEWSAPLAWWGQRRARFAQLRQGDMWAHSWAGYGLVYLFQRPESMDRALVKAVREMAPGSWLVSLEFEVTGLVPTARLNTPGAKSVWVYRIGAAAPSISDAIGR